MIELASLRRSDGAEAHAAVDRALGMASAAEGLLARRALIKPIVHRAIDRRAAPTVLAPSLLDPSPPSISSVTAIDPSASDVETLLHPAWSLRPVLDALLATSERDSEALEIEASEGVDASPAGIVAVALAFTLEFAKAAGALRARCDGELTLQIVRRARRSCISSSGSTRSTRSALPRRTRRFRPSSSTPSPSRVEASTRRRSTMLRALSRSFPCMKMHASMGVGATG